MVDAFTTQEDAEKLFSDEALGQAPPPAFGLSGKIETQEDADKLFSDAALSPPESSTLGAAGREAVRGVIPAAVGISAAGAGAAIGSLAGPVGALVGGLGGMLLGAMGGEALQDYAVAPLVSDDMKKHFGFTDEQRLVDEAQHPYAAQLGGLVPYLVTSSPFSPKAVEKEMTALERFMQKQPVQRAVAGGLMGAWELGQEALNDDVDWTKVATATAFGVIFNHQNRVGQYLHGIGARPVQALTGRLPVESPEPEPARSMGGALFSPRNMPDPRNPTLRELDAAGVMGPGNTEYTWMGTQRRPALEELFAHKRLEEEYDALYGPQPPTPDQITATARKMEPELFVARDALEEQRRSLEGAIDVYRAPTMEQYNELRARRTELENQLAETKNKGQQRKIRTDIRLLTGEIDATWSRMQGELEGKVDDHLARLHNDLAAINAQIREQGRDIARAHRRASEALFSGDAVLEHRFGEESALLAGEAGIAPELFTAARGSTPPTEGSPAVAPPPVDMVGERAKIAQAAKQELLSAGRPGDEAEAASQLIAFRFVARATVFRGARGTPYELYVADHAKITPWPPKGPPTGGAGPFGGLSSPPPASPGPGAGPSVIQAAEARLANAPMEKIPGNAPVVEAAPGRLPEVSAQNAPAEAQKRGIDTAGRLPEAPAAPAVEGAVTEMPAEAAAAEIAPNKPISAGPAAGDRIVMNGTPYKIASIDDRTVSLTPTRKSDKASALTLPRRAFDQMFADHAAEVGAVEGEKVTLNGETLDPKLAALVKAKLAAQEAAGTAENRGNIRSSDTAALRRQMMDEALKSDEEFYQSGKSELPPLPSDDPAFMKEGRQKVVKEPQTLLGFVRGLGGIKDWKGELKSQDMHRRYPGLVNNKKGMALDKAREAAAEAGYLPEDSTPDDLVQALLSDEPVYSRQDFDQAEAFKLQEKSREIERAVNDQKAEIRNYYPELEQEIVDEAAMMVVHDGLSQDASIDAAIAKLAKEYPEWAPEEGDADLERIVSEWADVAAARENDRALEKNRGGEVGGREGAGASEGGAGASEANAGEGGRESIEPVSEPVAAGAGDAGAAGQRGNVVAFQKARLTTVDEVSAYTTDSIKANLDAAKNEDDAALKLLREVYIPEQQKAVEAYRENSAAANDNPNFNDTDWVPFLSKKGREAIVEGTLRKNQAQISRAKAMQEQLAEALPPGYRTEIISQPSPYGGEYWQRLTGAEETSIFVYNRAGQEVGTVNPNWQWSQYKKSWLADFLRSGHADTVDAVINRHPDLGGPQAPKPSADVLSIFDDIRPAGARKRDASAVAAEPGAEGKPQFVIPGAERASDKTMAQRQAEAPMRGGNEPAGGMFDEANTNQRDLFQNANDRALGKIKLWASGLREIFLKPEANPSTIIHETGHDFIEQMRADAAHELAPQQLRDDWSIVRGWLGMKEGQEAPSRKQHEKFARGFERYLYDGIAPSEELAVVFQRFANWLREVYRTIAGLETPEAIPPEIRAVFGRLLAVDPHYVTVAGEGAGKRTMADIHDAEARTVSPERAGPMADRAMAEATRATAELPRTTQDELKAAAERAGVGKSATGLGRSAERAGGMAEDSSRPAAFDTGSASRAGDGAQPNGRSANENAGGGGGRAAGGSDAGATAGAADDRFFRDGRFVDKAGNIRLENLLTWEDIKEALREIAYRHNGFIAERRGVIPDFVIDQLASEFGLDGAEEIVKNWMVGQAMNAEQIMALRILVRESAADLHVKAKAVANGGDWKAVRDYAVAKERHIMIQRTMSGVTAEAGRALRAFRDISGSTQVKAIEKIMRQATGQTLYQLRDEASLLAGLDSEVAINRNVRHMGSNLGEGTLEYATNNLISGPITHAAYTISNQELALWKALVETPFRVVIANAMKAMGKEMGPGEVTRFGEVWQQILGLGQGFAPALKAGAQSMKVGLTTRLPRENMTNLPGIRPGQEVVEAPMVDLAYSMKEILPDLWGASRGSLDALTAYGKMLAMGQEGEPFFRWSKNPLYKIPDAKIRGVTVPVGGFINSPSRLVSSLHAFNRIQFYFMELNAEVYRAASAELEAGTIRPEDFSRRLAELKASPDALMIDRATKAATETTQMAPGGQLTQRLSRFVNSPIGGPNGPPLLRFIDPFIHISSNVLSGAFLKRTPLGFLSGPIREDLLGKNGKLAQTNAMARMAAGTSILAFMGMMKAQGYITGAAPEDKAEAATWALAGYQPYSIKINGTWYPYHRLGVLGLLMGIGADLYDVGAHLSKAAASYSKDDLKKMDEELMQAMGALLHSISNNVFEESFMRGPAELMKAVEGGENAMSRYTRNFISTMLTPFSVGMSQVARMADPVSRQARTLTDAIKNKIPGMSQDLFPRRNLWGEPIMSQTSIATKSAEADPVSREVFRLGVAKAPVERKIRGVELTDEQYDNYQRIAGRMSKMQLEAMISSPNWIRVPDPIKKEQIEKTIDAQREAARGLMMMKFREIPQKAAAAKRRRLTEIKTRSLQ